MANLTLSIDDALLKRARIKALERGTSVNAVVREYIGIFADDAGQRRALARLAEMAEESTASSGPEGRTWSRESLYDTRTAR